MDVCWRELAATPPVATMPSPPPQQSQSQLHHHHHHHHSSVSSAGGAAAGIMAGIGRCFSLHRILVMSKILVSVFFYNLCALSMRLLDNCYYSFYINLQYLLQRPRHLLTLVYSEPALLLPHLPRPCFPPPTTTPVTMGVQCDPMVVAVAVVMVVA